LALFHIAERAEWRVAGRDYAPGAFDDEGFVHCSYAHQVLATAHRYYRGRDDLVLLEIDESRLTAPVIVEPSPTTGERFPHVYGRIGRDAVVAEHELRIGDGGDFVLPDGVDA
jgi:uncharacterized protein (DUF952 family)